MAKWFGQPKRGAPRQTIRDVRIERGGKNWTASYHVEDGRLMVSSAWGSRSEPAGTTKDLAARATVLLADILNERR